MFVASGVTTSIPEILGASNVYKSKFSRIFYGSARGAQKNSRRFKKFAAPTIICCNYYSFVLY
jgi:hypothetical protein